MRERKLARNPSLNIRARSRSAAVKSASMATSATYFSLSGFAMWESELEKMAAVAESAATTRCRDEPKIAKATRGSRTV